MGSKARDLKQVLVVDDQQGVRKSVAFECELLNCEVIEASDGKHGFEQFEANKIDLIISDIRMPVWTGVQFLKAVREISDIPFIFMSGFADILDYEAYDVGADGFLSKPFNADVLDLVIQKLLKPLDVRWTSCSKNPSECISGHFNDVVDDRHFQLGRNGVFVSKELIDNFEHIAKNQLIKFQFLFSGGAIREISGVGVIAWKRESIEPSLEDGCGIEFEHLDSPSNKCVLDYLKQHRIIQSIPKGSF